MKRLIMIGCIFALGMMFVGCEATSTRTTINTTDSNNVDSHNTSTQNGNESSEVVSNGSTLEVPTFNGNSQGKLVVQCEDDVVYYIMAYDCLKADTKPSVTVDAGELTIDEDLVHVGEVFYTKGHVERTGEVTITGKVFSGGVTLSQIWTETCD